MWTIESNKENSHIPSVRERPTHIHTVVHTAPAVEANKGKDDEAIVFNSANKRLVALLKAWKMKNQQMCEYGNFN